jgi:PAS domain S-box-containing protein
MSAGVIADDLDEEEPELATDELGQRCLLLLLEQSKDLLWLVDGSGRVVKASLSHARALGQDPFSLVGLPDNPLVHADDRELLGVALRQGAAGHARRVTVRLRDGAGNWLRATVRMVPVWGAVEQGDHPHAERAAIAFAELEDTDDALGTGLFRTLAENVPGTVYLCRNDATYSTLYLSDAIADVTGLPAIEFLTGRISLVELYHPDDVAMIGRTIADALTEHRAFHMSYRLRHREGAWRWVEEHGQGVYDEHGQLVFLEGTIFDVSERRRAEDERRALEQQLLHAQKLDSLGLLAGGIAHDFNNILLAIIGSIELAQMKIELGQAAGPYLDEAINSANHAADLTRQLLAYAGKGKQTRARVNLGEFVTSMRQLLRASIAKRIHLDFEFTDESTATVECDRGQLQQILLNLVINAGDAIGDRRGRIGVRTRILDLREVSMLLPSPIDPGRYAMLEIQDDGIGMDEATRQRIFDPFFTTKLKGHGLGLAAVLGIVRSHQGGVELRSEVGVGTWFRVFLPLAHDPHARREPEPDSVTPRSATILLIDEDPGIRALASETLRAAGHRVFESASVHEAIERIDRGVLRVDPAGMSGLSGSRGDQAGARGDQAGMPSLDVLIVDLPEGAGTSGFETLRARLPNSPMLCTGTFDDRLAARGGTARLGFLAKPYRAQALAERVRALLRGSGSTSTPS